MDASYSGTAFSTFGDGQGVFPGIRGASLYPNVAEYAAMASPTSSTDAAPHAPDQESFLPPTVAYILGPTVAYDHGEHLAQFVRKHISTPPVFKKIGQDYVAGPFGLFKIQICIRRRWGNLLYPANSRKLTPVRPYIR